MGQRIAHQAEAIPGVVRPIIPLEAAIRAEGGTRIRAAAVVEATLAVEVGVAHIQVVVEAEAIQAAAVEAEAPATPAVVAVVEAVVAAAAAVATTETSCPFTFKNIESLG